MQEKFILFVYGTLLAGESNHHRLGSARLLVGEASAQGSLVNTGCGYPALVLDSEELVHGELYELDARQLQMVDHLEGYEGEGNPANYYERVLIEVASQGRTMQALTYVFTPGKARALERIESGDWRIFVKEGY